MKVKHSHDVTTNSSINTISISMQRDTLCAMFVLFITIFNDNDYRCSIDQQKIRPSR